MLNSKLAFANLIIILSILACQNTIIGSEATPPPADIYLDLRNTWLTTKPEDLALTFEPGSKVPYAILMDMGIDGDTATIASSIVGDGSLLTSTGGGYIGGVEVENVRQASIRFVEVSGGFIDRMKLTTEFPLPSSGYIRFYVITPGGVYMTDEVKQIDLSLGSHELSPLYFAGDDVITELRIASGG